MISGLWASYSNLFIYVLSPWTTYRPSVGFIALRSLDIVQASVATAIGDDVRTRPTSLSFHIHDMSNTPSPVPPLKADYCDESYAYWLISWGSGTDPDVL